MRLQIEVEEIYTADNKMMVGLRHGGVIYALTREDAQRLYTDLRVVLQLGDPVEPAPLVVRKREARR
jgi:hypothetical protein